METYSKSSGDCHVFCPCIYLFRVLSEALGIFYIVHFSGGDSCATIVCCCGQRGPVLLSLGLGSGRLLSRVLLVAVLGEILPLPPSVKINERLHATPFHDLLLEPYEINRL